MKDDLYLEGLRVALRGRSRESYPADLDEQSIEEWVSGWDSGSALVEKTSRGFTLDVRPTGGGMVTADIYNRRGVKVGELRQPVHSGEEAQILARAFWQEHPELFDDQTLLDTAEQSEQKSPGLYGDDGLQTIPEN